LLDINPPDVRVRDFGSLNGTYVNGEKIGQRDKHQTPAEGAEAESIQRDLSDGDEVCLGKQGEFAFRVNIVAPVSCSECSAEIPKDQTERARQGRGLFLCKSCLKRREEARRKVPPKRKKTVCPKCGGDVSSEVEEGRHGEFVCANCRSNPLEIVKFLLRMAGGGENKLLAIEGYEILRELGRGGMGAVYLARHKATHERVALKVMLPQVAASTTATQNFLRETENTKALRHPNVVQLRDAGCSHGTFFFTLEFCDGGSVDKLARRRGGTLSIDQAAPIVLQALDGLEYAHHAEIPRVKLADGTYGRGRGLVHRDLSPPNIFLCGSGRSMLAKVGDYGLSKAFDLAGLSGHTRAGSVAGKPWFMPRQQVVGYKKAKPEVDVWAMAASLYNMLTGFFPRDFPRGKDPWCIVLERHPVPIRNRSSSVPKRIAEVIDAALVDQPGISFQSAAEFKRALEAAL